VALAVTSVDQKGSGESKVVWEGKVYDLLVAECANSPLFLPAPIHLRYQGGTLKEAGFFGSVRAIPSS